MMHLLICNDSVTHISMEMHHDGAFGALADPTRRRIVELLSVTERDAGSLADEFAVSRPAVSRHLRVLREAGVVASEVVGRRRVYRLVPEALNEVERWAHRYRTFWQQRLDVLAQHLSEKSAQEEAT